MQKPVGHYLLIVSILALAVSLASPSPAQLGEHDANMVGWVPREIRERQVPLRQGIGRCMTL
jgi:hypothetical protein